MAGRPVDRQFQVEQGFATDCFDIEEADFSDDADQIPDDQIGTCFRCEEEGEVSLNTLDGPDAGRIIPVRANEWISGMCFTRIRETGTTVTGKIHVWTSKV